MVNIERHDEPLYVGGLCWLALLAVHISIHTHLMFLIHNKTNKQANKQTNKEAGTTQATKETRKQTDKQTSKQTTKQPNKRTAKLRKYQTRWLTSNLKPFLAQAAFMVRAWGAGCTLGPNESPHGTVPRCQEGSDPRTFCLSNKEIRIIQEARWTGELGELMR